MYGNMMNSMIKNEYLLMNFDAELKNASAP
jgi:hypothetical protein